MKNGTLSNKLVLVDNTEANVGGQDFADDSSFDPAAPLGSEFASAPDAGSEVRTALIVFTTLSIACTTAAIAAGSYALWLSRHQAARKTLTDVNDLLRSCQRRMSQLEEEVQNLPICM